jgi:hypothetical protein
MQGGRYFLEAAAAYLGLPSSEWTMQTILPTIASLSLARLALELLTGCFRQRKGSARTAGVRAFQPEWQPAGGKFFAQALRVTAAIRSRFPRAEQPDVENS